MPRLCLFLLACSVSACRPAADERLPNWQVTEDIRVGNLPAAAADSAPYDLEVGLSGTMFLLVPQAREVRVYAPAGDLINIIRAGSAPFVRPTALGTVSGNLWVYDSEARVLELVQANGTPVQTVRLQRRGPGAAGKVEFHTMLRDGSMILRESAEGAKQLTATRIDPASGQRDTVAQINNGPSGILFSPLDGLIVAVDALPPTADSVGFRLSKLNIVGDTMFTIPWRHRASQGEPTVIPAFMGHDGSVFVGYGGPGRAPRWTAFNIAGKPIAQFETPQGIEVVAAGPNYIYGIDPADGEPTLKRFRLQPSSR